MAQLNEITPLSKADSVNFPVASGKPRQVEGHVLGLG